MIHRWRWAAVLAAAAVWTLEGVGDLIPHTTITDIPTYLQAADRVVDGQVPYRDFAFEYPPLAILVMLVPRLLGGSYDVTFSALMFVALATTVWGAMATARALGMSRRRELVVGGVIALLPVVLGDFVATRFDVVLAALLTGVLWSGTTGRFRLAWAFLAAGVALKLSPIILVPVLVLWHRRSASGGQVARTGTMAAAATAATFIPALVASPSGLWALFSYHLERPLQIESLGSSYLLALKSLAGIGVTVIDSFGSQNLFGNGARVISAISTVVVLTGVGAVALIAARRVRDRTDAHDVAQIMVAAIAATLAVAIVAGKVLSPQFLVWLLPACLLVSGRYGRMAAVITVAALIATQAYFPRHYWDLVALDNGAIATLIVRNALLIALVAAAWPRRRACSP